MSPRRHPRRAGDLAGSERLRALSEEMRDRWRADSRGEGAEGRERDGDGQQRQAVSPDSEEA